MAKILPSLGKTTPKKVHSLPLLGRLLSGLGAIALTTAFSSCSFGQRRSNVAITHLIDKSISAEENERFQVGIRQVCQAIASTIQEGDESSVIPVTGDPPLFENLQETNPTKVRRDCKQRAETKKSGTLSCPAFETAKRQFETSDKTPILVAQIQVNEKESPCPDIWRSTSQLVIQRGGYVLIVNSSNDGGESFRPELESALEGLSRDRLKFHQTDPKKAVKKAIQDTRQNQAEVNYAHQHKLTLP